MWQSCCGAAAHSSDIGGLGGGADASAVRVPVLWRGGTKRMACLSLHLWCVRWFRGARGVDASCAAGECGLSLHTGSSVRVACLSRLVPLCAWLVSPHWILCAAGLSASCAAGGRGLSLHTDFSVRVSCLPTLDPLCTWLVSPHWFLCARVLSPHTGSSVHMACLSTLVPLCARRLCLMCSWGALGLSLPRPMMRAASLPLVQLGRAWLIPPSSYDARGVSASCAAGARLAYPSLVL